MKSSTFSVLRANVALVSLSLSLATALCLALNGLLTLLAAPLAHDAYKFTVLALAIVFFQFVKRRARRAFEAAKQNGKINFQGAGGHFMAIDTDCPAGWLVQLHVELHAPSLEHHRQALRSS